MHLSLYLARGVGEAVSQQDFQRGRAELEVFRQWFDGNVLSSDPDTRSDAVMIMPYGMGGPKYRDAPNRYGLAVASNIENEQVLTLLVPLLLLVRLARNSFHHRSRSHNW